MTTFNSQNLATLSAIAKALQVTPSAVANWSKAEDFPAPAIKVGRTQAWDAAAVVQWGLANDRIKAPSELRALADAIEAALAPDADDDEAAADGDAVADDAEFVEVEVDEV